VNFNDLVIEDDFSRIFDFVEYQSRQVTTAQCNVTTAGQLIKHCCPKASRTSTFLIDQSYLAHIIADASNFGCEAHTFRDVIAQPPEIDDVAALLQRWRSLDEGRIVTRAFQPIRESWLTDSDS
jgi:hypothetical protein